MKHSIISWDCSFRNFFHLIPSLVSQEFDNSEYELIYVEQKTKEWADNFNQKYNLPSLKETAELYSGKIKIKIIYLEDSPTTPYHLGRCVNMGIRQASGEIISIMDGDQLLPPRFLCTLEAAHNKKSIVIGAERHMCAYPVGAKTFKNWGKAIIDYQKCLKACPSRNTPISPTVGNFGPLISARKELWGNVEGYDEGSIWSTSASTLGCDTANRLCIAAGTEVVQKITDFPLVHPWHPVGFAAPRKESDNDVRRYLELQRSLTHWSKKYNFCGLTDRQNITEKIILENQALIEKIIASEKSEMSNYQTGLSNSKTRLLWVKIKTETLALKGRLTKNLRGK